MEFLKSVLLPYFNLAVFLLMFFFFFRKPIVAAARMRREKFLSLSQAAAAARKEAEEKLRILEKRLLSIDQEISEIREDAIKAGRLESERIEQEALRLAEFMKNETQRLAAAQIAEAKSALQREIAEAVKQSVESKLEKSLDSTTQASIVQKQAQDMRSLKLF